MAYKSQVAGRNRSSRRGAPSGLLKPAPRIQTILLSSAVTVIPLLWMLPLRRRRRLSLSRNCLTHRCIARLYSGGSNMATSAIFGRPVGFPVGCDPRLIWLPIGFILRGRRDEFVTSCLSGHSQKVLESTEQAE